MKSRPSCFLLVPKGCLILEVSEGCMILSLQELGIAWVAGVIYHRPEVENHFVAERHDIAKPRLRLDSPKRWSILLDPSKGQLGFPKRRWRLLDLSKGRLDFSKGLYLPKGGLILEVSCQNVSDLAPRLDIPCLSLPEKQNLLSVISGRCPRRLGIEGVAGVVGRRTVAGVVGRRSGVEFSFTTG